MQVNDLTVGTFINKLAMNAPWSLAMAKLPVVTETTTRLLGEAVSTNNMMSQLMEENPDLFDYLCEVSLRMDSPDLLIGAAHAYAALNAQIAADEAKIV